MVGSRTLPWLGVGTSGSWDNPYDAMADSGIDYEVEQVDAWDDHGNRVPGILVNRRCDGDIMGVTSDAYGVVQNEQAFSLLDPFCSAGGVIEHAGMTVNGMVFMVMRVPSAAFSFASDTFEMYVCAMNSFNGKFPLALIITPIRVYCQNMFRRLLQRSDTILSIKHGRFASSRIISASKASSLLLDYRSEFADGMDDAALESRTIDDVWDFAERMLPLVPETKEHPRAKASNERIRQQRDEFVHDYYMAADNMDYQDSRLGILNAYYDWITHHVPPRASMSYEDVRFSSLASGTAANRKLILSA